MTVGAVVISYNIVATWGRHFVDCADHEKWTTGIDIPKTK